MKKLSLLVLVIVLAFAELHLWNTALAVGEQRYKNSHRIYMAFKSAYHYGYQDCRDGRKESWEGDE